MALVNKGRNGKYFHLKKCQNMEVVNYFTKLPFQFLPKIFFHKLPIVKNFTN